MSGEKPAFVPRMEGLDALRGFALFGLFMVHMPELFELYWAHPVSDPHQLIWHDVVFLLFSGKAFALLALCFGVSFYIIMDRQAAKGQDFTGRFLWRLVVLFALGLLHTFVYRGEVLEILAVMGVLLVPFYRVKSNAFLLGLGVLLLLQPWMWFRMVAALSGAGWANEPFGFWSVTTPEVYLTGTSLTETLMTNFTEGRDFKWLFMWESGRLFQIMGLFLVGLVLGRIGFFQHAEKFARMRIISFVVALAVALVLYHVRGDLAALVPTSKTMFMPRSLAESMLSGWFDLSVMFALMMGFLALYYGFGHAVLNLLAPAGRMTLTLYVMQSLIFIPVFYSFGLGLHATMLQSTAVLLGLAAFALQVVLAHIWFRYFLYGPLEWLWRAATYLTLKVPFVRRAAT